MDSNGNTSNFVSNMIDEFKNTKRYMVCTRTGAEVECTEEGAWNDFVEWV